jgi:hypothetical protein
MKGVVIKIRGVDVSIDFEGRKVWFDDEVPEEMVKLVAKYLVDEGFVEPEKNTELYDE